MFSSSLIARLKQEGWETFVFTGNKSPDEYKNTAGVLEAYNYDYDNSNIPFIIENTKVDVLIFTGALDNRFTWSTQSDAITYLGGLYNMLLSASKSGVKRFIYLSTTDIYENLEEGLIDETSPTSATGLRLGTILNGEKIALQFQQENDMQVVILRCSEVYGAVNKKVNKYSFCTNLCINVINGEKINIEKTKRHDNLHISDLTELVFNTMNREESIPNSIYNICSGNALPEHYILNMIKEITGQAESSFRNEDLTERTYDFSNELAEKELGFSPKFSFKEGFSEFVRQQVEKVDEADRKKEGIIYNFRKNLKDIFSWFFPYLETILTFLVVQIIIILFGNSELLSIIDLYLLYVVFIAIIYGKGHTITALLLSLGGKLLSMGQYSSLTEIAIDYKIYLWLLQLLVVGMGIGFIRDNYKQIIGDSEEENNYLKSELAELRDINSSNVRIKEIYENRLINYKDSFAMIYSILSKLDDLEPDKIMFSAVEVVSEIIRSDEVAIYSVDKGGYYARLMASSTNIKDSIKKSIQLSSMGEVFSQIQDKKIYVNRKLDQNKPSMAGGVYHENILESIIVIRSLPFEYTTLYHMNLFSVVLNLIAQALHRANHFIEESQLNRYIEGTNVLTQEAFYNIIEIRKSGSEENLADYFILEVVNNDMSLKQLNDIILQTIRHKDYMGLGEDGRLYLLLANTTKNEAEFLEKRLSLKGIETRKGTVLEHGT